MMSIEIGNTVIVRIDGEAQVGDVVYISEQDKTAEVRLNSYKSREANYGMTPKSDTVNVFVSFEDIIPVKDDALLAFQFIDSMSDVANIIGDYAYQRMTYEG